MMKKFVFLALFAMAMLSISSVSVASPYGRKADPDLLSDMYANPINYVCTGTENFGVSFYIDKRSIEVHQYNPPHYIIAFRGADHKSKDPMTAEYAGYGNSLTRYKYDYASRKMYIEEYSQDGRAYWEYVETRPLTRQEIGRMTGGAIRYRERKIVEGEIAFYLAYNMSFFDQPISGIAKEFINSGLSDIPSEMSPIGSTFREDNKNYYVNNSNKYNHREKRYEVWQTTYDKRSKTWSEKRIK